MLSKQSAVLALLSFVLILGCSKQMRNAELAAVAKDWSMVVRASQVIPVYPLTEDLQPGDILLVQIPIEKQQDLYNEHGFLPLDNLIRRVHPSRYQAFYERSFGVGQDSFPIPRSWMYPTTGTVAWREAPSASFPTYSFSVRSGGGFNLALPVQGVPIGLSLLGGDAAEGTITIADARTYGIDTVSLYADVSKWAKDNAMFLANFAPSKKGHKTQQNYLRVISRVYLTGRLNVSLQAAGFGSGGATGGAAKPLDLVVPAVTADPQKDTVVAYAANIQKLTDMIEGALKKVPVDGIDKFLPGGTVKVAAASSRTITLIETFNRPLVFGYLAFDIAIQADGMLGPPIPTHSILVKQIKAEDINSQGMMTSTAVLGLTYDALKRKQHPDPELIRQFDELERLVPNQFGCNLYDVPNMDQMPTIAYKSGETTRDKIKVKGFHLVTAYKGKLLTSIETLEKASADRIANMECPNGSAVGASCLQEQLSQNRQQLADLERQLAEHSSLFIFAEHLAQ